MALVECPECRKHISEDAELCPNCGKRFSETPIENKQGLGSGLLGFILIGFSVATFFMGENEWAVALGFVGVISILHSFMMFLGRKLSH